MSECEVCHAKVGELRRGRCWGCYTRWAAERPVGLGAACCVCSDRRHDNLKQVELLRAWVPMCHNCAAKAMALSPMPRTIEEVRSRLTRDRRAADRRGGRKDGRVFPRERRGLERRATGAARGDDLMILDEADILIIEDAALADLLELEPGEETRIIERIDAGADRASLPIPPRP